MTPELPGWFFDGSTSRRIPARLEVDAGQWAVTADDGQLLAGPSPVTAVKLSSRLGNTPRFLDFPGAGRFETSHNDAIDELLRGTDAHQGLAYRLESSWRLVLLSLVLAIAFAWGGIRYGIPALAETLAFRLPASVGTHLGDGTLALLDRAALKPSALPAARQQALRARFLAFAQATDPSLTVDIQFRDAARSLGANALALPSGTLVFTDQLVSLADHDDELLAVLAHELGHLERRHALRHVLQSSGLGLVILVVTGDVSSISASVSAIPVVLAELGYSRAFEYEADRYAAQALAAQNIPASRLTALLERLERASDCHGKDQECPAASPDGRWAGYLSTHPSTAERRQALQ
ncbi:M48 family metallopeptidase [Pseudomonas sp. EpS/L25]|uniref:M48 family metallopeptidase n=1 Tax=Pseudomonas sp. EpS/L25 TaxID=1749078 RepID=UPI0009EC7904|nr:M48 family metallopeptidase [Pseudomonas sp. EpS/L25]